MTVCSKPLLEYNFRGALRAPTFGLLLPNSQEGLDVQRQQLQEVKTEKRITNAILWQQV